MSAHTEAAIRDLRVARSYLDEWYDTPNPSGELISRAARYIEEARAKDPTATIETTDKHGRSVTRTIDSMAGEALFIEASLQVTGQPSRQDLVLARITLEKALGFAPYMVAYRAKLAEVLLDLYQRDRALEIAQEGVRLSPDNVDAIKLLDKISAAPDLKPPTHFEKHPESITLYGVLMAVGGLIAAVFVADWGILLLTIGVGLYFYGRRKEKQHLFAKAVAEQYRKRG